MGNTDRGLRLDGSTLENPMRRSEIVPPGRQVLVYVEIEWPIENDTHGAVLVVLEQQDDGTVEVRVDKRR